MAVERATEQMVSSSSTVNFDDASSRQKLCVSEVVQSCSAERKLAHTAHPTTTTRLHPSPFAHRAIPRLQQQPLIQPLSVFYPAPLCRSTTPQFNISYPTFFKSHSNILDELCIFLFFFFTIKQKLGVFPGRRIFCCQITGGKKELGVVVSFFAC